MAVKMLDMTSAEATATDCTIGANTVLVRYLCPFGKTWTYDPSKHKHFYLPQTAGPVDPTAGTRTYMYKAGNEVNGSKARIKEIVFERLPTLVNQANSQYDSVMRLTPFTIEAGQELQVFVHDTVLVVTAADSTHSIEVEETDQLSVLP